MLTTDELKYIEMQIKKTISSIEQTHFQFIAGEEYKEKYPGWTESWLKTRLKDLYLLIFTYLEGKEMLQLSQTFKAKYEIAIETGTYSLAAELTHPEGEPELILLVGFKQFLEPFKFFDYRQVKEDETIKLTSILRNTGFILKNMKAKIVHEADIYKQVKWVLGLYYPTVRRGNKASFIKEFKSYNPDILIPELKTAIEYKYIDNPLDNIDDFLDQLKGDSTNYVEDHRYDTFYAVIYIEDISIATPESIEVAWKAKNFPNNWSLVLSGHTIKTND
jgi:hypothetical protein